MNNVFVYFMWSKNPVDDIAAWGQPILYSIMSLRKFNKTDEVIVVDVSKGKINWGEYPKLLNFKVLTDFVVKEINTNVFDISPDFQINEKTMTTCYGYNHVMHKVICCQQLSEKLHYDVMIVSDADIIWTQNPFPLLGNTNYFCHNQDNSGFYYFKKNSAGMNFLKLWSEDAKLCLDEKDYAKKIHTWLQTAHAGRKGNPALSEEDLMLYTQSKHPDLIQFVHDVKVLLDCHNVSCWKGLHFHVWFVDHAVSKTDFVIHVKELREIFSEYLTIESRMFPLSKSCELLSFLKKKKIKIL